MCALLWKWLLLPLGQVFYYYYYKKIKIMMRNLFKTGPFRVQSIRKFLGLNLATVDLGV
jgi:hypothetical protein